MSDSSETDTDTSHSSSSEETEQTTSTESSIESSSDENVSEIEHLELENKILGKYNIINKLGQGADAIVWLAYNIEDNNFYAIKVNEPNEFKKGMGEFKFMRELSTKLECINHLKEAFIETRGSKKYVCGVFNLHTGNIDSLIRKGDYSKGFPIPIVKMIMRQLLTALKYLHQNKKVYHADIKTDNILVKGINNYDKKIIEQYKSKNFFELYNQAKKTFWINKGKSIDSISNMKSEDKTKIRHQVHEMICKSIDYPELSEKNKVDSSIINKCNISLADFGAWCGQDEHYDCAFGTRYYRAPEVILVGKSSYPVDIWAAGCVLFELITGTFLFDPDKTSKITRDEYHLYNMSQLFGDFSKTFLKSTQLCSDYFNSKGQLKNFPKVQTISLESLIKKRDIEPSDDMIDLLTKMLKLVPSHRLTADQCLKHPFLQ